MKITSKINPFSLRIYINDILHVSIKRSSLVGTHAWKERDQEWWIEYRFRDGQSLKSMYDTEEKWVGVAKCLDEDVLFTVDP